MEEEQTPNNKKRGLLMPVLILILAAAGFAGGYFLISPDTSTEGAVVSSVVDKKVAQIDVTMSVEVKGAVLDYEAKVNEGATVMDVMKAVDEGEGFFYEAEDYDFGTMVNSINGMKADDAHFWSLEVNGEMAEMGADAQTVKDGDEVAWVYTELQ
ncbi:MAG: DUF4430 domain-containing protein [bacterium]